MSAERLAKLANHHKAKSVSANTEEEKRLHNEFYETACDSCMAWDEIDKKVGKRSGK